MNAGNAPGQAQCYRLFVLMDDKYYWAVEWKAEDAQTIIVDLNAGFISALIMDACRALEEISPEKLRQRFGPFADYVVRCIGGFRSYISWTYPDSAVSKISWSVAKTQP